MREYCEHGIRREMQVLNYGKPGMRDGVDVLTLRRDETAMMKRRA
jgi:hypothetical protein